MTSSTDLEQEAKAEQERQESLAKLQKDLKTGGRVVVDARGGDINHIYSTKQRL